MTQQTSAPLLRVKNLETYYGPVLAIRGVSLDVHHGQIVTILGANGAGKTTLLKTISGIMNPEKGGVWLEGRPIHLAEPDRIVRDGVVHVPEGREIFPLMTVGENLSIGAYVRSDRAAIKADQDMVYAYFPILKEKAGQRAGMLSGGQQQMLAIGRALMARPRLMLLDEPSLGLSPLLVQEIFAILRRLNTEQKVTMLLVEQNAQIALGAASFAYVMELGRIVMAGDAERLKQSEDIQAFYLGLNQEGERGQRRWKQRKTWR
jgi:branched-chain amino acid transport system ATP-binding protein